MQGIYTTGASAAKVGWQLLGSPYPSPLDCSTLKVGTTAANNLQNMNGAVYVFQSSGPYAGTYRSHRQPKQQHPLRTPVTSRQRTGHPQWP